MILKLNKGGKFDPCHAGLWTKKFHQTGGKIIDSFGLFGYFSILKNFEIHIFCNRF